MFFVDINVVVFSLSFVYSFLACVLSQHFAQHLYVKRTLTLELDVDRVGVLTDGAHVLVGTNASSVDLFRVDAILRVKVLHLTGREDAVDAAVELHLGAEVVQKREALLLARELQQVRALAHDGGAASL